jgi:hypothetical protein
VTGKDGTALVSSLVKLAVEAPAAIERINAWLHAEGDKPEADLVALPDLTRMHLELAALELRAQRAGA